MEESFFWNHIMAIAFLGVYAVLVIELVVMLVLDNRNPVKTMAWMVVLLFLPVIGVALYFFFGRNTRKERLISRKSADILEKKSFQGFMAQSLPEQTGSHEPLVRLFRTLNHALPFKGNRCQVYTNGYDMLASLLHEVSLARHHIHLEYYIFEDDAVGRLLRDCLADKVRQGVEVRLLYDDVGCWHVRNDFYDGMRAEGMEVRGFMKVRFPLFTSKVNYRNHRKIVVIDGKTGFIGGMNIAKRYVKSARYGTWRDTHLKIEGPAVYGLQSHFLMDWFFVTRSLITATRYYPPLEASGNLTLQTVASAPVGEWKAIMQGYLWAIGHARQYVYVQTPYFLPSESVAAALQTAALAGVDVRLMLPGHADSVLTHLCSLSYVEEMLKAGVKVYFYQKGFLHAKTLVSDDRLFTTGSTNMDFRSFEHNFEINTFIYDENMAQSQREVFRRDQHDCTQMTLKAWQRRPAGQRARESIVRLLSPLL